MTTETTQAPRRGGGELWVALGLIVLAVILGFMIFLNNDRDDADGVAGRAESPTAGDLQAAERASGQAAEDTGRVLEAGGGTLAEEAGDAVEATGDLAARAAEATGEAARDTAVAAEAAVARSTDGDPDSDNNEPR